MSKKDKDRSIDKINFMAMNYELAGEIGVLDDEDMKNNRKIKDDEKEKNIINPS